jgi:hypothetical protein
MIVSWRDVMFKSIYEAIVAKSIFLWEVGLKVVS